MVGRSLVRSAPSNHEILTTTRNELDLTDLSKVREFFHVNKVEAVIMAAARVGGIFANSNNQTQFLVENLAIQNSIFQAAVSANVENFIFLGSSCIYPKFAEQPIRESSLMTGTLEETNESYAIAKIAGVRLCKVIADETWNNYISLMPTNLYGPHDNFDLLTSHVPAALLRRFHEAVDHDLESVGVWGTGKPIREFMHVDDLASACWHFLQIGLRGDLINIGTGVGLTIEEFANKIAKIVGFSGKIVFDLSKPDGTPKKVLDVSKATSFGWTSKIPLDIGLRDTYNWFIEKYKLGEIRGI